MRTLFRGKERQSNSAAAGATSTQSTFEAQVRRVAPPAGVTGSGTTGNIPTWAGVSTLGDSGVAASALLSGSGASGRLAFWTSAAVVSSNSLLFWDDTNKRLGVNKASPVSALDVGGTITATGLTVTGNPTINGNSQFNGGLTSTSGYNGPSYNDTFGTTRFRTTPLAANWFSDGATTPASGDVAHDFQTRSIYPSGSSLHRICNGSTPKHTVDYAGNTTIAGTISVAGAATLTGKLSQGRTDTSATPGNATANTPTGRSAIAAGASSVVITNSLVTAASQIHITKRQFDTALTDYYAVCAAGSFTVTGNAAATAAWAFDWQVFN